MIAHPLFIFWLSALLMVAPSTAAAFVICICALFNRSRLGPAFRWVLLGFGLLLFANLLSPGTRFFLQTWAREHSLSAQQKEWLITVFGFSWSLVYSMAYLFIALSIFTGRRSQSFIAPPPLPGAAPMVTI